MVSRTVVSDKVASLVVAVPDVPDHLAGALRPLSYPLSDAAAFQGYVRNAWPQSPPESHVKLPDGEMHATQTAIRQAIDRLSRSGHLDMFFVYLSGHGLIEPERSAWFCTADLAPGQHGLDASGLDELLNAVSARHTFLFLDCCHAAQIIAGSRFFTTLSPRSLTRLYICSSKGGQLTWEDDTFGHGLFSAVLLEALRTGQPGRDARGPLSTITDVDVEGELFPYLCREVPLIVHRRKYRAQEPVKGGIATFPVRLPVGDSVGSTRAQTVMSAVFQRLRRIAIASAIMLLLAIILIELFSYHLGVDDEGRVVIQRGIRPLAWLLPGRSLRRVQSDFVDQDFVANSGRLGSLRDGSTVGVWHVSNTRTGYRDWLDDLLPDLKEPVRARTIFELSGSLPEGILSEGPGYLQGWRCDLVATSLLTTPEEPDQRGNWLALSVPRLSAVDPETGVIRANSLDFMVLKLSTPEMVQFLRAMGTWAISDPDAVVQVFPQLIRITCYRAAHGLAEEQAVEEERALEEVLGSAGAARSVRGQPALTEADSKNLFAEAERLKRYGKGRQLWAVGPMARLGPLIDQRPVQAALAQYLETFDPDRQGPFLNLSQNLALNALGRSTAGCPLSPEALTKIISRADQFPRRVLGFPEFERFLLVVAPRQEFPPALRDQLWQATRVPKDASDADKSGALFALRMLAANVGHLPAKEREAVVSAASSIVVSRVPNKLVAEIYGWLGTHGVASEAMVQNLCGWVVPGRPQVKETSPAEVPGLLVIGGDDEPAGIALGQVARRRALLAADAGLLYDWVAERWTLHGQQDLMEGLATQRELSDSRASSVKTIRARIARCSRHAGKRALEVHIAINVLVHVPRGQRYELLSELWNEYLLEEEVEVRQGLHRVWVGTRRIMDPKDAGLD
jgi:hypothetical protein